MHVVAYMCKYLHIKDNGTGKAKRVAMEVLGDIRSIIFSFN